MMFREVSPQEKEEFNKVVSHPLQSYEWGEFREKTGVKVIRRVCEENGKIVDGFQLTIHKIPHAPFNIGYLPKGNLPTKELIKELQRIGKEENCIFIQLEPNATADHKSSILNHKSLIPSAHPLFTKYTLELDLVKSEEELLKNMHSKTRYNIRVAQKHGVEVKEDNTEKAFEKYLKLTDETTKRQNFYAHTKDYHKKMWSTLKTPSTKYELLNTNVLTAHLLTADYHNKILTTWILFVFQDRLYYPYGASTNEHREVMANNLVMWEAIRFGKKLGLKKFDMWGALSENPDPKDPWFGFHRFKTGYGPKHIEFVGSYDLVISPAVYQIYKLADKLRWMYLRLKK